MPNIGVKDLDVSVLAHIAHECRIPVDYVEDVYACTPFQAGLLTDSAVYIQRFTHEFDPSVDLDRYVAALSHVISLNEMLRTRIVDCDLGLVQVVLKNGQSPSDRVQRAPGPDIDEYLQHDRSTPMGLATPLSRFAIVGRTLVITIHHAISDVYTLTALLSDTQSVYEGRAPCPHAPFKRFVEYCGTIDERAAAAFWKAQFKGGVPAIFPATSCKYAAKASRDMVRHIALKKMGSAALMPAYIETAWSLAAADYTGSDVVAFGYVMSGRSAVPGDLGTTLGPTITTVPMQVRLYYKATSSPPPRASHV